MHTSRASKQPKTGPEMRDLDGDGKRWAVSVGGVIRFTGSRDECERRLEILSRPTSRERQDKSLGRIFGAIVLGLMVLVPRGTNADSSINTALPAQGPYNAAPIRQNFGAAASDITALQRMNAGATAPASPVLGQLWLETPTGETTYKLKVWDNRTSVWVIVAYFDSLNSLWISPVGGGLPQTILSADTTDLGTYPNTVLTVTGAGPILSFGTTSPAGTIKVLSFSGVTTLTQNATSMILPGAANITTAAGDMAIAVALGSGNWQVMFFQSAAASVAQGGTGRTSLTQYNVLLGAGTSPVNFAAPGTSGYPLLSAGAAANPAFGQLNLTVGATGVLPVANGGTGLSAITANNLMLGNGTSAATLLPPGTAGRPLVSLGAGLNPSYAVLGAAGGGTGLATLTQYAVPVGNGTGAVTMVGPGTNKYPLVANGGAANPAFQPLDIASAGVTGILAAANGGLGVASPTDHAVLVGSGAAAVTPVGPGTNGYPLIAAGAGADPAFAQLNLAGGGITGILPMANFTTTPTFATVTTTGNAAVGGTLTVTGNANLNAALAVTSGITAATVTTTGNAGVGAVLTVTGATNLNDDLTAAANITADALPTVAAGTAKHFVCIDPVSGAFYRGTGASCN